MRVLPLRTDALAASRGSTPFGSLFLALSSFVIVAGLLLEGLLVALLVAARHRDLGILAAVGFSPRRVAQLLLTAGGVAAGGGVVIGTLAGPLWARALLAWLGTAWTSDVETGADAVFQGAISGGWPLVAAAITAVIICLATLAVAAWRAASRPPLVLLRGIQPTMAGVQRPGRITKAVAIAGLSIAAAAAIAGRGSSATAAVGLFFTAGFGGLAGLLAIVRLWLAADPPAEGVRSLVQLARRNLAFAPGRAFSVAAIVAAASFLIVAVSSFAKRPPVDPSVRSSPTGGWTEILSFGEATSIDPTNPETRSLLGLSGEQEALLAACTIARLRTSDGDDAACSNLYASLRPRVIGVGPAFIERGGFSFVDHAPLPPDSANPWQLLDEPDAEDCIPVILDQATAQWGLKLGGVGSRFDLTDDDGATVRCVIVGLLESCILQGQVIVAERGFERMFPRRSGYGMALVDAGELTPARRGDLLGALATAWADAGVSATAATRRLASLQAVENTFLSGFQVLGTLGLLLGTAGVAAVQLQGVSERIGPLSVLRSIGFTLGRVRWLLISETLVTVLAGLAAGIAAACLAVAPALGSHEARLPLAWIGITVAAAVAAAVLAAGLAASRATIPTRPAQE